MVVAEAAVLAAKGGKALMEVANQPVIGWTRIQSYDKGRKHPRHIEERTSFNVRAWEIGLLGVIAILVAYPAIVPDAAKPDPPDWLDQSSPFAWVFKWP